MMNPQIVGNIELISNEEELLVSFLKKTNLEKTNANDKEVIFFDNFYVRHIKRGLDLLIAIPAFIITIPFNVIFGICTYFDVGRPIFYKQTRIGKNGQPFVIVKFRNMNVKTDYNGNLLPAKNRVTKFGKIMRKYSFDEFLNFWSVLKGDMSIIGPRPLPVFFYDRMSERHKMRTNVRPGLECPRVIHGEPDQCQYQNQFENDIWYITHISLLTDLKLLFLLFKMPFSFTKRSRAAEGHGYFAGYDQNGIATTLNRFKRMYPREWEKIKIESQGGTDV